MIALLAALSVAAAADLPFDGEQMRWAVSYAGVTAGYAWARAAADDGGGLVFEAGCENAPWYGRIYTIDDLVRSTWAPGAGSSRYETRFREGNFHQDQDMRFDEAGFEVWRRQRIDGEWREWTTPYPAAPVVEDPVSAIYALRLLAGDGPWVYDVFSGRKTWQLLVDPVGHDHFDDTVLGDVDVDVFELKTAHEGDVKQKGTFLLYVTADERRIPVKVTLRSNIGPVHAELIEYTPPTG